jgi:hypothetical protein
VGSLAGSFWLFIEQAAALIMLIAPAMASMAK